MEEILSKKVGKKIILLGNEAIVRGALESGVQFVSTYPGTPASDVGDTFYTIQNSKSRIKNLHFEYSTNEKVAMEAAAGAALSGLRSLVAMKNFGLNVASDFFFPLAYTGIKRSMVIFVADDPSCWSSAQTEQDTRYIIKTSYLPLLEPSTPQEAKDFVILAFDLSEKFKLPIVLRHTTRISHQSAPVTLEKIRKLELKGLFIKDPNQFSTMPPRVLEMKKELLGKIEKIKEVSEKSKINLIKNQGKSNIGIITSGISYLYVMEAIKKLNLSLPVLKLGFIHPLPEKKVKNFLKSKKEVLVVEELEPYLEREIKVLAQEVGWKGRIYGKEKGNIEGGRIWQERKALMPKAGELKPEYVVMAISKILKKKTSFDYLNHLRKIEKLKIPSRPPILCPGCPYWFLVNAIKKVVDPKKIIFGGEIGCYMLFKHKVINLQDYLFCMGSDVGVAHGISKSTKQKIVAFVGDSSFFHAEIPALINTVVNESNPLVIIMDNQTTAMTGHQPHPGRKIKIENIVKALGVKNLKVIDQVASPKELEKTIKEFLGKDEISVIVARHPCALLEKKKS